MKNVLVIGAGAQGGPCASILARDPEVEKIIIADIDLNLCQKVQKKINSNKITALKLDAGNLEEIENAARGCDVVITLTLPVFNQNIMQAALNVGAHYVDTSFGEPELMDICERDNILSQIIQGRDLMFDKEYKQAGLTALVGCGGTPGFLNVGARYLCDKLDQVDEIRIKFGEGPVDKSNEELVSGPWDPGWSPFRALWGYAVKPTIFRNGKYDTCPVFDEPEIYRFPEPLGEVAICQHQHQEQVTLPFFIGKGIQFCEFKYPVDNQAATFVKMGFGGTDTIQVKGQEVSPRDVLMKLVGAPVNGFLEENKESAKTPLERTQIWVIDVKGKKDGKPVNFTLSAPYTFILTTEDKIKIFDLFGSTDVGVALPAVIGAKMCVSGHAASGTITAECLDPNIFLKLLKETGVPIAMEEKVNKV
ncbi:MAG: saccharopine dehydrogenase NADP-binding domain-containing protein [Desulfobacterales bacterium]|nr:saccharopine dehydrogenase NADP-binding domain-containing protein [Desulfobacterales bacterium]